MEIHVISLLEATERRQYMAAQLASVHVQWAFFDAVRYTQAPSNYDQRKRAAFYGFPLTLGEMGCYASHRELWRLCAQAKTECWCILEDDVTLLDGFEASLEALRRLDNWGVVRLMPLQERYSWRHQKLSRGQELRMYHEQPCGTQGYLITPSAAARLYAFSARMYEPIDTVLDRYWRHQVDVFCVAPPVIRHQEHLPACIGTRGWISRPKWPGFKRDLCNAYTHIARIFYNYGKYHRIF